jgi:pSer/pThr/pTyr-binding forkhead associated (FHA) protein
MLELYLRPWPSKGRLDRVEPTDIVLADFPCVFGRHSRCHVRIDDMMISRQHCQFILRDDWVWLEDLGSRHGTLLNGDRISRALPLTDGDVVQMGNQAFEVRIQKEAATAHPEGQYVCV